MSSPDDRPTTRNRTSADDTGRQEQAAASPPSKRDRERGSRANEPPDAQRITFEVPDVSAATLAADMGKEVDGHFTSAGSAPPAAALLLAKLRKRFDPAIAAMVDRLREVPGKGAAGVELAISHDGHVHGRAWDLESETEKQLHGFVLPPSAEDATPQKVLAALAPRPSAGR
jgi:hypothetical protein